ncbi:sulfite exporter TauE/SafE family protein [Rhodococcus sp. Eu-32]|uniref:sulfite exporter TauE/SafE family protein n=1 Tax=Rhodococcus sp. Eu-32 TaxID=1017319 RepID=UPI000DF3744F|nr:sulfite exporter TauE/SafE family protein [Rhodococcus sp. Eu-32]RRQ25019.1 sulfite exporter TauE/SafE family protein [Rhodococcus sp. Eu-32]
MTLLDFGLLVVAGFFAGLVGFVTGLASLVSYPALLAAGLPPVAANVTNTVGLVAAGIGATANASSELAKDGKQLVRFAAYSAIGGLVGALVLLWAPAGSFEIVVPFLVAFAAVALLLQPRLRLLAGGPTQGHGRGAGGTTQGHGSGAGGPAQGHGSGAGGTAQRFYPVGLFFVAIYGGYFGAGAGVIFLALALVCTSNSMWRASILKSFFLGVANLVAAVIFAFSGEVNWLAALALSIGAFVGGYSGPPVVKVIPPTVLRIGVGLCGLGLAAWLFLK